MTGDRCDVCGIRTADPHTSHDPGCPRGDRWCAKSREAWCAVVPDKEPVEGSWSVSTVCGYGITLPWGYDHRQPNCPDCLAAIGDCDCDNQTCPDHCWHCTSEAS